MAENLPTWACTPKKGDLVFLKYTDDGGRSHTISVGDKRGYLIGRNKACDIVIRDKSASRYHAAVVHDAESQCYLLDLGSAHGTFLEGKRLDMDGKEALQPDVPGRSTFTVGRCPSTFQLTREGRNGAPAGGQHRSHRSTDQAGRRPLPRDAVQGRPGRRPDFQPHREHSKRVYTPGHYGEQPLPYGERGGSPVQHVGSGPAMRGRGMRPMAVAAPREWGRGHGLPGGPNFRGRGYIDFRGRAPPGRGFVQRGRGRLGYGPRPDDRYQPEPEPVLYETEDGLVVAEDAFEAEGMDLDPPASEEPIVTSGPGPQPSAAGVPAEAEPEATGRGAQAEVPSEEQAPEAAAAPDNVEAPAPGPQHQHARAEKGLNAGPVEDTAEPVGQDSTDRDPETQSLRPSRRHRRAAVGREKPRSLSRPSRWGQGSPEEGSLKLLPENHAPHAGTEGDGPQQAAAADVHPPAPADQVDRALPTTATGSVSPSRAKPGLQADGEKGAVAANTSTQEAGPAAPAPAANKTVSNVARGEQDAQASKEDAEARAQGAAVVPDPKAEEAAAAVPRLPRGPSAAAAQEPTPQKAPQHPAASKQEPATRPGLGSVPAEEKADEDADTSSDSGLPEPLARLAAARKAQREARGKPGLLTRLSGGGRRPLPLPRLSASSSESEDGDGRRAGAPAAGPPAKEGPGDAGQAGSQGAGGVVPSEAPEEGVDGSEEGTQRGALGGLEQLAQYDGSSSNEGSHGNLGRRKGGSPGKPATGPQGAAPADGLRGKDTHSSDTGENEEELDGRREDRRERRRERKRDRHERDRHDRDGDRRSDRRDMGDYRRREAPRPYYDDRRGYRGDHRFDSGRGWRGGPRGRYSRDFVDRRFPGRFYQDRDRPRGGFINKSRDRRPYERSPRRDRSPREHRRRRRSPSSSRSRSVSRDRGRKRARSRSASPSPSTSARSSSSEGGRGGAPPPASKQRASGFAALPKEFEGMDPADIVKQMGMGPGGGTALSVEAKKKLLWGKKAEPEAVKDAEEVFGANRWDAAEFDDENEKQKFIKLMGVKAAGPTALTKEQALALAQSEPSEREALSKDKAGKVLAEVEHQFMEGLRRADGRSLGLGL